jgi:hypothetical protein
MTADMPTTSTTTITTMLFAVIAFHVVISFPTRHSRQLNLVVALNIINPHSHKHKYNCTTGSIWTTSAWVPRGRLWRFGTSHFPPSPLMHGEGALPHFFPPIYCKGDALTVAYDTDYKNNDN